MLAYTFAVLNYALKNSRLLFIFEGGYLIEIGERLRRSGRVRDNLVLRVRSSHEKKKVLTTQ